MAMAGRSKAYRYMQRAVKCSPSFPTSRYNPCPGHPTFSEALNLPLQSDPRIQGPQLPKVDGSIDVTCTTSSSLGFTVARGSLFEFAGAQAFVRGQHFRWSTCNKFHDASFHLVSDNDARHEERVDPFSLVADELTVLANRLRSMVSSEVPKLACAAEYFFKTGVEGKRFRPMVI
ncbi:hypothetical protein GOP47_0018393 [Adiantum capillus-veneris]|uniref:Uncharacterized protein n=1 Tax=Adiantum capillus-veneris TaxID=13818 RepID=A0A9D4Z8Q4_ADICA|nr:hypothetical protein GOP47_0018393 [Adiantum capillus-veneris]